MNYLLPYIKQWLSKEFPHNKQKVVWIKQRNTNQMAGILSTN